MNELISHFEVTITDIKLCHHFVELVKVCILKNHLLTVTFMHYDLRIKLYNNIIRIIKF